MKVIVGSRCKESIFGKNFHSSISRNDYDSDVDSPVTDEEERPLTQNELRQRIMKGVSYVPMLCA